MEEKGIQGNKIPDNLKEEWLKYCADDADGSRKPKTHYILQVQQKAKNHKGRIMTWMAYWPFSLTWWLLRDLLRKLWERLYRMIGGTLDKLSAWIYKGVDDDFPADTPKSVKQIRSVRSKK